MIWDRDLVSVTRGIIFNDSALELSLQLLSLHGNQVPTRQRITVSEKWPNM